MLRRRVLTVVIVMRRDVSGFMSAGPAQNGSMSERISKRNINRIYRLVMHIFREG